MALQEGLRHGGINPKSYKHPADRAATAAATEMGAVVAHYRERFLRILGVGAGGVERATGQPEGWLRPRPGGEGAGDRDDTSSS